MAPRNPKDSPSTGGILDLPPALNQLPTQAGSSAPCPKLTNLLVLPEFQKINVGVNPSQTSTSNSVTRVAYLTEIPSGEAGKK